MTLKRVWIPSPNYSSRGGSTVRLIVLHTAEGALSYQSLGSYFGSSSSGVSSHVGIDDTPNTVGEYVKRSNKAWTASNANPVAAQAELCGFAAWSLNEWNQHPTMLQNTALWLAEESAAFNIPLTRLTPSQAQGYSSGVCMHVDLGQWGGGHTDCGTAFPFDDVLAMARSGVGPSPLPPEEEEDMDARIVTNPKNNGKALLDLATGEYKGISSGDMVNYLKAQGVKEGTGLTVAQWEKLHQTGTL